MSGVSLLAISGKGQEALDVLIVLAAFFCFGLAVWLGMHRNAIGAAVAIIVGVLILILVA